MIKLLKIDKNVEDPKYQTSKSSGFDVRANSILKVYKGNVEVVGEKFTKIVDGFKEVGYIKLRPFERILFGTGLQLADMDESLEIQVRSRSGKTLKQGLIVANQPGTIDADYRGEIGVIIYNSSPFLSKVNVGERIAQLVVNKVERPAIKIVTEISESERGSGGFGSTGDK